MGWEKRGMFRNVKVLKLNDPGTWRRGGIVEVKGS
jgi:hypothetical protein